ncbi:hypothetical protein [Wenjunlia tyrosinilytica]|jgi:hypothetical protein|uniref:Secreted protein n=1 Tax=Wenjunlia tyrosinilytica TaxID=1544741 RepID=A0A917ZEA4_9ACTN|nr:hypothetical protein [Wenjunlia tyrosinilytica]GGO80329.1 hypothetical protein GCM10012280_01980 [Wenjunlia tyrosinilytica]
MSAGVTAIVILAAVLVLAAIGYAVLRPKLRTNRLRRRFGTEYDRALAEHGGSTKEAEDALEGRLRRHRGLDIKPLTPQAREMYVARWTGVQEAFVDHPTKAVVDADHLIGDLLKERGYPTRERGEAMDVLSVEHASALQSYRQARDTAQRAVDGKASTEELREAMLRTRTLFAELIGSGRDDEARGERATRTKEPKRIKHGKPTTPIEAAPGGGVK